MKYIKLLILLVLTASLTACFSGTSQLVGKWQLDENLLKQQPVGNIQYAMTKRSFEFTPTSYISGSEEDAVEYVEKYGKAGAVFNFMGEKITNWYQIVDADTIATTTGRVTVIYHRVKLK